MTPRQAMSRGLLRAWDFQTPAPRAEYWWFLPVGLALPVLSVWIARALWPDTHALAQMLIALAALVPQMAVTCRRLRDSGEGIAPFEAPFTALVIFAISTWAWLAIVAWLQSFPVVDAPAGFGLFLIAVLATITLVPVALYQFCIGLLLGSALFAQMAAPTHPRFLASRSQPKEVPQ